MRKTAPAPNTQPDFESGMLRFAIVGVIGMIATISAVTAVFVMLRECFVRQFCGGLPATNGASSEHSEPYAFRRTAIADAMLGRPYLPAFAEPLCHRWYDH